MGRLGRNTTTLPRGGCEQENEQKSQIVGGAPLKLVQLIDKLAPNQVPMLS